MSKYLKEELTLTHLLVIAAIIMVVFFPGTIAAIIEFVLSFIVWTLVVIFAASLAAYVASAFFSVACDTASKAQ